jgi:acyl-CoA hydrolase
MEIFVQAWAKKILSQKAYLINEAYFTFVALDDNANTTSVPAIKPGTDTEKKEYINALKRKTNLIKTNIDESNTRSN